MKQIIFNVQKTFLKVALVTLALNLLGCGAMPESPPQTNRFKDLIDESKLKIGSATIKNSKMKVLAIVYSENVSKQLDYNKSLRNILLENMKFDTLFQTKENLEDYAIVLSEERLMSFIVSKLSNKFLKVIFTKDIPTAFANNVDYVGILDLKLELNANHSIKSNTHIASTSLVFINKFLENGPEIKSTIKIESGHEYQTGVANYYRTLASRIKIVRTKMLNDFGTDLDSKVFN